jgi:phenylalanyl-tRNA synthetase beta chain
MTFVAPATLSVGRILDQVRATKLPLLEDVFLADVFTPEDDEDTRHLTFRFTFRHASRTLKDKEVDKEVQKVAESLQKALPIKWQ